MGEIMILQPYLLRYLIISLMYFTPATFSRADESVGILVSSEAIKCVSSDAKNILQSTSSDPIIVFLEHCPGNNPSLLGMADLPQALTPGNFMSSDTGVQSVLPLLRAQLSCLSLPRTQDSLNEMPGIFDIALFLERFCGY